MCAQSQLPQVVIQDYLGEPIESGDVVEFRLLYVGRILSASRSKTRADLKHEIRREFHPQLRRLWETNSNLKRMTGHIAFSEAHEQIASEGTPASKLDKWDALGDDYHKDETKYHLQGKEILIREWRRNGFSFLPLVTEKLCLRCSLDILFLRPEEPGLLIESGDIDGRVKTIFDALRMPANLGETGGVGPLEDENPFYCLLEDDKLISEVRVTTDQLLLLPREKELKPNDAMLVIHVKINPITPTGYEWVFR